METVPQQPTAKPPIRKTMPIVLVLLGAVLLIGISTAYNAMTGSSRMSPGSGGGLRLSLRPFGEKCDSRFTARFRRSRGHSRA